MASQTHIDLCKGCKQRRDGRKRYGGFWCNECWYKLSQSVSMTKRNMKHSYTVSDNVRNAHDDTMHTKSSSSSSSSSIPLPRPRKSLTSSKNGSLFNQQQLEVLIYFCLFMLILYCTELYNTYILLI